MPGHKNLKTTQHYAGLLHKKIGRDMGKLKANKPTFVNKLQELTMELDISN